MEYISVGGCEEPKEYLPVANVACIKICISSHHGISLKNIINLILFDSNLSINPFYSLNVFLGIIN
jgi:hypothetical protein